jgi:hypothetical protein
MKWKNHASKKPHSSTEDFYTFSAMTFTGTVPKPGFMALLTSRMELQNSVWYKKTRSTAKTADPHWFGTKDPDLHWGKKLDPNPHWCNADPQQWIKVTMQSLDNAIHGWQ